MYRLVENTSGLTIVGHWRFCVECVSRYWELTLRNVDGLGSRVEEVYRREGSRVFPQDLLSSLGMGTESKERPLQVVCYRVGCEPGGLHLRRGRRVKI